MILHITIPAYIQTALNTLETAGFEAYLVGGCVRDALLGQQPEDFDIATNALPEQTLALFEGQYEVLTNGQKHGTITPIIGHKPVEITTYRIDGDYTDNRHPDSVQFSRCLEDDLARRDFTVNALAYSETQGLVDRFGGQEDLHNKILRCVGEPDARFGEDALRILRALRFGAVLGFSVESETAASMRRNMQTIQTVSAERIYTELKKLLAGDYAANMLKEFPGLVQTLLDIRITPAKTHALAKPGDAAFRLSVLFLGEEVENLRRLKPDNKTYRYVQFFVRAYRLPLTQEQTTCAGLARFMYENGMDVSQMRTLLRLHAYMEPLFEAQAFPLEQVEAQHIPLSIAALAVNGSDLTALGYAGKAVKVELDRLLKAAIDGKCPNEKEALLKYTEKP